MTCPKCGGRFVADMLGRVSCWTCGSEPHKKYYPADDPEVKAKLDYDRFLETNQMRKMAMHNTIVERHRRERERIGKSSSILERLLAESEDILEQ